MQRVLVVHNRYRQRGGEDSVVEEEVGMLQARGHEVRLFERSNFETDELSVWRAAADALTNKAAVADFEAELDAFAPDVIHVHNTWMRISPAVIRSAARRGVPVVQTLHNFRLTCPQGLMLRDGKPCESCVGRLVPWPAVVHRCYRGSMAQSAMIATTLTVHRLAKTYRNGVDRFIALNEFCRQKMIEAGLPASRMVIKPNFMGLVPAPDPQGVREGGLFVGRLSDEKGLATLSRAAALGQWNEVTVVGDGEWLADVQRHPNLHAMGALGADEVFSRMQRAGFLLLPSIWYENFPRTIVEAYAAGLPVIASRLGSLPSLVEDGVTGLLFEPGNAADLAEKVRWALAHPQAMQAMSAQARRTYEQRYTSEVNYPQLMSIYQEAARHAAQRRGEVGVDAQANGAKPSRNVG
jgi:glycosyltransferase involved in cell wall biosynthesis